MNMDTQFLIIQLLNQELRKANHRATKLYFKEVQEAKVDFVNHISTLGTKNEKRSCLDRDWETIE